jgi:hypothetical protein
VIDLEVDGGGKQTVLASVTSAKSDEQPDVLVVRIMALARP